MMHLPPCATRGLTSNIPHHRALHGTHRNHQVSVGNLISGSRAGTSPTTLLTTLVSTDSVYLNFDMSEADYMTFLRNRQKQGGPLAEKVQIALADESHFTHEGTLDFIDNTLDRIQRHDPCPRHCPGCRRPPDAWRVRPRPRGSRSAGAHPARAGRLRAA